MPSAHPAARCRRSAIAGDKLTDTSVNDARTVLRSALTNAMVEKRISKNGAQLVKVQRARRKRPDPWSVEEACAFLQNAESARDYLYAAYVLILVLGLRKGEALGLTWSSVYLDTGELEIQHQLQRVRRQLIHSDTAKAEASRRTSASCREQPDGDDHPES